MHQVENEFCCDCTPARYPCVGDGCCKSRSDTACSSAIRIGDMKLYVNNPGDSRHVAWPELSSAPVPFGLTGGSIEAGTDHARAPLPPSALIVEMKLECRPFCLFNLTDDIGEQTDLAPNPVYKPLAEKMLARLRWHGSTGPPPAYIWPGTLSSGTVPASGSSPGFEENLAQLCDAASVSGFMEPLKADDEEAAARTIQFSPPVLIDNSSAPRMMYVKGGAQSQSDPAAVLIGVNAGDIGAAGEATFSTRNGGRSWEKAWNVTVDGQLALQTVIVPGARGQDVQHDLVLGSGPWGTLNRTRFPISKRVSSLRAAGVSHFSYSKERGWNATYRRQQEVTFDLSGHQIWTGKAKLPIGPAPPIVEPPIQLDQMGASAARLPDGSMVLAAVVTWGGNPASVDIVSQSIAAFRSDPPFLEWKLCGVVANASQFPGAWPRGLDGANSQGHGYNAGPNENAMVLLGDNKTLMLLFRDQAETPPAVPPTGTCLNCAYRGSFRRT